MKLEDLVIQLKIEKDNKIVEKKYHKRSTIIGVNIVKEAPTKDKRERSPTGRSQKRARRNSKATVIIVARLFIGILIVVLQEGQKQRQRQRQKSSKHRGKEERCR